MPSFATWFLAAILTGGATTPEPDGPRDGPAKDRPHVWHPLEQGAGLELNRALRLARRRDCDAGQIVANIVTLGPEALPACVRLLDECKLPAIDGGEPQVLSTMQEMLLLDAIGKWKSGVVWTAIDMSLAVPKGKDPTPSARRAAVLAAGTCGVPDELRRITGFALLPSETELDPRIERALQVAVESLYRRWPEGLAKLAYSWREFRPALLPALVKAAGASGDPRALEFLTQMLNQTGDLQAIALAELTRQRAPLEIPSGLFEQLRDRLDPARPMICQSACNGLGALGDFESVDSLVDLLASPSAGVRTTTHRVLCSMSGLALPVQTSSWHTWRVRESQWFAKREAKLYSDIVRGTERQAREALQEISVHRWERHRLSDIAAEGLKRSESSIRSQACSVLGQLGSPRARAALQDALRSEDSACVLAAKAALTKYGAL